MGTEKVLDLDQPVKPEALPGLGISDLLRYAPIISALVDGIQQAIAHGSFTVPAITIRVFGQKLKLGPWPISLQS